MLFLLFPIRFLFPLDGAGRLRGEVERYAVDPFDFVRDAVCDMLQQCERDIRNGRGHCVAGIDRTEHHEISFGAFSFFADAHALEVGDDGEVLPYLSFQSVLCKFFSQNRVRFTYDFQPFSRDRAYAPNAQAGSGEGLTEDHVVGQPEGFSDHADFVLKQQFHGFHKLEFQIFGKPAHVVMRFHALAFQNVRVDRPLRQERDVFLFSRFFFKHADKFRADDLSFLFGIAHARQFVQKPIDGVHVDEVCIHLVTEYLNDLFGFPFSQ